MSELNICPTCKSEYEIIPENCNKCGFPFTADHDTKSKFIADQILKKGSIDDTKDRLKASRNVLFIIAALNAAQTIYSMMKIGMNTLSIINLIISGVFLFFALNIKKKPLVSVIIPLVLLIFFYTLQGITSIDSLLSGYAVKAAFLIILGYSIFSIFKSEKIKKESEFLGDQSYK